MKIALVTFTASGAALGAVIYEKGIDGCELVRYAHEKHPYKGAEIFSDSAALTAELFQSFDGIVFICACGIAVRLIAPHVVSKKSDPAVICMDNGGKYIISLLSGHIGRANILTRKIAGITGGAAVITTATDAGGLFSPDSFAQANDLVIGSLEEAKLIASAVIDGEAVGIKSDYPMTDLPDELTVSDGGKYGMRIASDLSEKTFEHTLNLVPKNIVLGIGCRRDTDSDTLEKFVLSSLSENGILPERICAVSTIDIKKDEAAINAFCDKYGLPLTFYSAEELMSAEGEFTSSEFVLKTTGTDNVCERSAVMSGGRLIMKKQSGNGVTAAAAEKDILLDFRREML